MDILEAGAFPVAEFYLVFFGLSLLILSLIVCSGFPSWVRKGVQAIRLIKARRERIARTISTLEELERAGSNLEGVTLFEEDEVFS